MYQMSPNKDLTEWNPISPKISIPFYETEKLYVSLRYLRMISITVQWFKNQILDNVNEFWIFTVFFANFA